MNRVLTRIGEAGLKLKPAKCKFGDRQVDYLGFTISDQGLQPSRKKVEALMKIGPPSTSKVLHSFLCAINFYRNEIPNYGNLTCNLFEMANSKVKQCKWTMLRDFEALKQALGSAPILMFPDFNLPFVIQGDASKKAIGGACMQSLNGKTGVDEAVLKPVSFYGRKLSAVEQRYTTTERELLSLVYGLKCSHHLVYGRDVVFYTDHEPLVSLVRLKNPLGRLGRLLNYLVDVRYKMIYIAGKKNYLADFMSRGESEEARVNFVEFMSSISWAAEQNKDLEISAIRDCVINGSLDNVWVKAFNGLRWLREKKELFVFNKILKHGSGRIVVPAHMKAEILISHHDSPFAGHRGFETTLNCLAFRYFWLFLSKEVQDYCRTCVKCQFFNYSNLHSQAPLMSLQTTRRGQIVGLDFMGPFRKTRSGNMYLITAVDTFSKFLVGSSTVTFDALVSAVFLFNYVCVHGMIERVLTDQGRNFEALLFFHLCRLLGANKVRTTAYHAMGNGGTERVNKVLKPALAKLVNDDHDNWDVYVQMSISAYNNSFHSSIGMTPYEAHFGRPSVMVSDVIMNSKLPSATGSSDISEFAAGVYASAYRINEVIKVNKEIAQSKQKLVYDQAVKNLRQYRLRDWVKIINHQPRLEIE